MKKITLTIVMSLALGMIVVSGALAQTVAEQMTGLQNMCTASADARVARQAETSPYERLGGYDRILDFCKEIVRLHRINPDFEVMVRHVDGDKLARNVADFISAGTGGDATYSGRSLPASHSLLRLTDADFLSAGADVMTAMKNKGYGQNEIDEMVCILVSLKDQVVLK